MKFVLAIDDIPYRYWRLARTLSKLDIGLLVTCRMEEVRFYLCEANYQICGILLDHDMPFQDGAYFVDAWLKERSIPVVVSSHNQPAAERLRTTLDEWAVPVICAPAADPGHNSRDAQIYAPWENLVLGHFHIIAPLTAPENEPDKLCARIGCSNEAAHDHRYCADHRLLVGE